MKRWLFLALLASSFEAVAAPVVFEAPGSAGSVPIAIYRADDSVAFPLAHAGISQEVELEPGTYRFGFDSYPWRSEPFEHQADDPTVIPLAALQIDAPEGMQLEMAVHEPRSGKLVLPVTSGTTVAVPEGALELRRDLSEVVHSVEARAGEVRTLALGALALDIEVLPENVPVYVALAEDEKIAAVLYGKTVAAALPVGEYRLVTPDGGTPFAVSVDAGRVFPVKTTLIRWRSLAAPESQATILKAGAQSAALPAGASREVVVFGSEPIVLTKRDAATVNLPEDGASRRTLWELSDGSLANLTGLPVDFFPDAPDVAVSGGTLKLRTESAERTDLLIRVSQTGTVLSETTLRASSGPVDFEVALPEQLNPAEPVDVAVAALVEGGVITGRMDGIAVHRRLEAEPEELLVAASEMTRIRLSWAQTTDAGVVGYRVFRDDDDRPISGPDPATGTSFEDIGLSAGRTYRYRVCPVDRLGLLGPCAETEAATKPHER